MQQLLDIPEEVKHREQLLYEVFLNTEYILNVTDNSTVAIKWNHAANSYIINHFRALNSNLSKLRYSDRIVMNVVQFFAYCATNPIDELQNSYFQFYQHIKQTEPTPDSDLVFHGFCVEDYTALVDFMKSKKTYPDPDYVARALLLAAALCGENFGESRKDVLKRLQIEADKFKPK